MSARARVAGVGVATLVGILWSQHYQKKKAQKIAEAQKGKSFAAPLKKKRRVAVDAEFWQRLKKLLAIVCPSWKSRPFALFVGHTVCLILRTLISARINSLDGELVRFTVTSNWNGLGWGLTQWLAIGIPATFTNSMIRYLESRLALSFRSRLTHKALDAYMADDTYYTVGNLDNRLTNADQCLTEDIDRFCTQLAYLHSHLTKPLFDIIYFTKLLNDSVGTVPIVYMYALVYGTGYIVRMFTPPFGAMVAKKAELEGDYRFLHSRLIANGEEIAFYKGHAVEKTSIEKSYHNLEDQLKVLYMARVAPSTLEGFMMKYVWSTAGFCISAWPIIAESMAAAKSAKNGGAAGAAAAVVGEVVTNIGGNTQRMVTDRRVMTSGADACLDLLSGYKEIAELAGYTHRVSEMFKVFEEVKQGNYVKGPVAGAEESGGEGADAKSADARMTSPKSEDAKARIMAAILKGKEGWGKVEEEGEDQGGIVLDNVPIVTPNRDVLVSDMTLTLKPGMHMLITGPNGCGKSSLFRILGGLWPTYGGALTRPKERDMFYIPQRPYLSIGTLREQIIYPMSTRAFMNQGRTDDELSSILDDVELSYLVGREGGWTSANDWKDVLSGGEKQKVAMARLLFHKPRFAILDECTSAVAIDVEGKMYMKAKERGITLMTVSHRASLWKFHDYLLQFDGSGKYAFTRLDEDSGENAQYLKIGDEKQKIEAELARMPTLTARLAELKVMQGRMSSANLAALAGEEDEE